MKDDESNTSISRVMRRVNVDLKISNAEFCRKLGVNTQNLNNWIVRGTIPCDKLIKVSGIIDRSIDWIMTGENFSVDVNIVNDCTASYKAFHDNVKLSNGALYILKKITSYNDDISVNTAKEVVEFLEFKIHRS